MDKKAPFRIIIIVFFIIIVACSNRKDFSNNYYDNGIKEVLKEEVLLIDVRTPEEFATGSVRGAVNIPLDVLTSNLNLLNNKKNIIVFCRTGNRSNTAKNILQENGFNHVYNGGAWTTLNQMINEK